MNKIIELNSGKDGYKHFKLVMHEIYPEEYFDDVKQIVRTYFDMNPDILPLRDSL